MMRSPLFLRILFGPFAGPFAARLAEGATASRQAALLWVLAAAVEQQAPMIPMLEAFAQDTRGKWRDRILELMRWIRSGTPLPEALALVPGVLPTEAVVAVRAGGESGTVAAALRSAAAALVARQESAFGSRTGVFVYLVSLALSLVAIVGFVMYWIIPKFREIFLDFGTELPGLTELVIEASNLVVRYFYLFPVPLILLYLAYLASRTERLRGGLVPRDHTPGILRILATSVESGRPLTGAVSTLARFHPSGAVRQRLMRVFVDLDRGSDVWTSLQDTRLVRPGETAILESASRAGNLPWALRAVADQIDRRLDHQLQLTLEFVRPLLLIGFGILVGIIVVGLFLPLVDLINKLS